MKYVESLGFTGCPVARVYTVRNAMESSPMYLMLSTLEICLRLYCLHLKYGTDESVFV